MKFILKEADKLFVNKEHGTTNFVTKYHAIEFCKNPIIDDFEKDLVFDITKKFKKENIEG